MDSHHPPTEILAGACHKTLLHLTAAQPTTNTQKTCNSVYPILRLAAAVGQIINYTCLFTLKSTAVILF